MKTLPIKAQAQRILRFATIVFLVVVSSYCSTKHLGNNNQFEVHHLVVLHTNDTHGHPVKFFMYPTPDVGGLPARATLINKIKKENKNVLVLDAGDLNTGRPESNLFKAWPDIEGYNYIGYDAITLGNHEFDNSLEVLKQQMRLAEFPFLSANVKTKDGKHLGRPYIIKEFDDFKVAIFGLTSKETKVIGNPENIKDLIFEDEIEVAKSLVPELREKADIVVGLVHMGIYHSAAKGSERLGSLVSGIDIIVDGHTHTILDAPIRVPNNESDSQVLIVQAWKWGLVVGKLDLFIRNKKVFDYDFETIPVNLKKMETRPDGTKAYHFIGERIPEDNNLLDLLNPYVAKANASLSKVIGHAASTFFREHVREQETPLGNIIADSMLWYTSNLAVDFAIQNGGGIRVDLPKGPITKGAVYELLPFDNSVMVLTVRGDTVQSLFDYFATITPGQGAFPQVSDGLSFTINYVAGKCEEIMINGKPLEPSRTYKIATNSYMAAGGDGYTMLLDTIDRYDSSALQRDVLIEYIQFLGGIVKPTTSGRIKIMGNKTSSVPVKTVLSNVFRGKPTLYGWTIHRLLAQTLHHGQLIRGASEI